MEICVLTVRDNEHDSEHGVGDDEVACRMLPSVDSAGMTGMTGKRLSDGAGLSKVGNHWEKLGRLGPRHPCIFTGEYR